MCSKLRPRQAVRGFTLIEMMIAISLLAVLSLLGWRALDSLTRTRTALDVRHTELNGVRQLFSQFESDCAALVPQNRLRFAPAQLPNNGLVLIRQIAAPTDNDLPVFHWQAVWYRSLAATTDSPGGIERLATLPTLERQTLEKQLQVLLQTPVNVPPPQSTSPDNNAPQRHLLLRGKASLRATVWLERLGWVDPATLKTVLPPFSPTENQLAPMPISGLALEIQTANGALKKTCVVGS